MHASPRALSRRSHTSRTALVLTVLTAGLAWVGGPSAAGAPSDVASPGTGAASAARPCSTPVLAEPVRVRDLVRARGARSPVVTALERQGAAATGARVDLVELAGDPTAWVGPCGVVHFVEPRTDAAEQPADPLPVDAPADLDATFELSSRPESDRVVYLDFTGHTVSGSVWNDSYGDPIEAAPFSLDATVSTDFSASELSHIQRVWSAVAEDFAPFDVDVTTRDPGSEGIVRSSPADTRYGTRVVVTQGGPIATRCRCAGYATLHTFGQVTSTEYYQPAWVFTSRLATYDALAASHEAGHNLGLSHDGTSTQGYYQGYGAWMPIMGGGGIWRVAQWSKGEYPDADNRSQDDLAVIAGKAPYVDDDHAALGEGVPTPLDATAPVTGLIHTRSDRDSFSFVARGNTGLTVTSPATLPNLDVRLTIRDASGTTIADVDEPLSSDGSWGLMALWRGSLPAGTYTATLDGVGTGDPLVPGKYSDYGSLGRYALALTTEAEPVDADAPVLTGFDFSPRSVDLAGGAQEVTVTARLADASGTLAPQVVLSSDAGTQSLGSGPMTLAPSVQGSPVASEDTWVATVRIPESTPTGSWTVTLQPPSDRLGNTDGLARAHPTPLAVDDSSLASSAPTEPQPDLSSEPAPDPAPPPGSEPSTAPVDDPPAVSVLTAPGRPRVVVRGRRVVVRWSAASRGATVAHYVVDRSRGRDRVVRSELKTVFRRARPGFQRLRIGARTAAGQVLFSGWVRFRVRR